MSRFYGTLESDTRKHPATTRANRLIESHTRGWDAGVIVVARKDHDEPETVDSFDIYLSGGSNHPKTLHHLASMTAERSTGYRAIELGELFREPDGEGFVRYGLGAEKKPTE